MPPGTHSILGASGAHRWLACTPSARLGARLLERFGEPPSPYAAEGTKAHALGELKIRYDLWRADKMTAAKHGAMTEAERKAYPGVNVHRYKALRGELGDIPEDMENATDTYADVVLERLEKHAGGQLFLEQRVDFSDWVPSGYGTADAIIVSDDLLEVLDYKHGKGVPVSAEGNPQLRLYALGAYKRFSALYDFKAVRYSIIQPRLNSVSREAMDANALLEWAETNNLSSPVCLS